MTSLTCSVFPRTTLSTFASRALAKADPAATRGLVSSVTGGTAAFYVSKSM